MPDDNLKQKILGLNDFYPVDYSEIYQYLADVGIVRNLDYVSILIEGLSDTNLEYRKSCIVSISKVFEIKYAECVNDYPEDFDWELSDRWGSEAWSRAKKRIIELLDNHDVSTILIELLQERDNEIVNMAMDTLLDFRQEQIYGGTKAFKPIFEVIKSNRPKWVKSKAIYCLHYFLISRLDQYFESEFIEEFTDVLMSQLRLSKYEQSDLRDLIYLLTFFESVKKIVWSNEKYYKKMLQLAVNENTSTEIRQKILGGLDWKHETDIVGPYLLGKLRELGNEESDFGKKILDRGFYFSPGPEISILFKIMKSWDDEYQQKAFDTLKNNISTEYFDDIIQFLGKGDSEFNVRILTLLGGTGDPRCIQYLLDAFNEGKIGGSILCSSFKDFHSDDVLHFYIEYAKSNIENAIQNRVYWDGVDRTRCIGYLEAHKSKLAKDFLEDKSMDWRITIDPFSLFML